MKKLIFLTALLATSAFAEFEVKVNRIEMSATDKVTPQLQVQKEVVDGKTNRTSTSTSTGDEAGTLKGQMKSRRLDVDSDGDGLAKRSR